jgi:O-antigen ligase
MMVIVIGSILVIGFLFRSGAFEFETKKEMFKNGIHNLSLIGYGINSFEETFPSVVEKWPIYYPVKIEYLENEYIQLFYEGGFLPFLFSIIVAFQIFYVETKNIFSKRSIFWLSAPIIAESVRVVFDMSFHIFPLAGTFVLLLGLSLKEDK